MPSRSRSSWPTDPASIRRRQLLALLALPFAVGACKPAAAPHVPGTADLFPDFALPDLQQQPRLRAEFLGAPRLINFWATWCPPCRAEMTALQALHRGLRDSTGGGVIAISIDNDANLVREFVRKLGIDLPVLIDAERNLAASTLGIRNYPTSYLLRADGRIADVIVGPRPWEEPGELAALRARVA